MLKGCQKKIIFLKDTGSDFFEEAYFVIKPDCYGMEKDDILLEATRIASGISENGNRKVQKRATLAPIFFALGMLLGTSVSLGCFFLLW